MSDATHWRNPEGTVDLGKSADAGHPVYVAENPDNRDGPYVLELVLRLGGYGTPDQAKATAERIGSQLAVALGRDVNIRDVTVTR